MEPTTLQTLIIESDAAFPCEIRAAICKAETQKTIEKLSKATKIRREAALPCEAPKLAINYNDILLMMEQNTGHYWMYDYEEHMYTGFSFEALKEEIQVILNDEYGGPHHLIDYYFFTPTTLKLLTATFECLKGIEQRLLGTLELVA